MKTVVLIGLGYIGLPTAALLCRKGFTVRGCDVNPHVVETITAGRIHIVEPDLAEPVRLAVAEGRLTASLAPESGDVIVIAVPTPFMEDHKPDLSYVFAATESILPRLSPGNLVLLESTSPVGTTERIAQRIFAARPDLAGKVHVAYCPERVLPGRILHELEHNDRTVGGIDEPSTQAALAFYRTFVKGECLPADARTAEMVKLTENSFRDVNIAFANELSMICRRHGINVQELIRLANRHPRVKILEPGCGVGGHCIAVDPWFIVDMEPRLSRLIRTAREVNDAKPIWVVNIILENLEHFEESRGRKPSFAVFGLAYKPDVDDLRESPALKIAEILAKMGVDLMVVEPNIRELPKSLAKFPQVRLVDVAAADKADLGIVLVRHREFKQLDPMV